MTGGKITPPPTEIGLRSNNDSRQDHYTLNINTNTNTHTSQLYHILNAITLNSDRLNVLLRKLF